MSASRKLLEGVYKTRLWKTARAALANIAYARPTATDKLALEAAARKRERRGKKRLKDSEPNPLVRHSVARGGAFNPHSSNS